MSKTIAVIGMGFGDEGKGVVVDYLSLSNPNSIVVRFNGGHQVGHTVVKNNFRHVFSNFGSGTLNGVPTYWSKYCTIDPVGIVKEYELIKNFDPILYIDADCPITTPYEKLLNISSLNYISNGTVGVGFGHTIEREEKFQFRFIDLYNESVFRMKMEALKEYYKYLPIDRKSILKFIDACYAIKRIAKLHYKIPTIYDTYIAEGAQGLLLDQHKGFFPYVTRSNTDLTNLINLGLVPDEIYAVARTYLTRHGNGPMCWNDLLSYDVFDHIEVDENETNKHNETQGSFRYSLWPEDLYDYSSHILNGQYINHVFTHADKIIRPATIRTSINTHRLYIKGYDSLSDMIKSLICNTSERDSVLVFNGPKSTCNEIIKYN
jgi:adenylosuccinate synthase